MGAETSYKMLALVTQEVWVRQYGVTFEEAKQRVMTEGAYPSGQKVITVLREATQAEYDEGWT